MSIPQKSPPISNTFSLLYQQFVSQFELVELRVRFPTFADNLVIWVIRNFTWGDIFGVSEGVMDGEGAKELVGTMF